MIIESNPCRVKDVLLLFVSLCIYMCVCVCSMVTKFRKVKVWEFKISPLVLFLVKFVLKYYFSNRKLI